VRTPSLLALLIAAGCGSATVMPTGPADGGADTTSPDAVTADTVTADTVTADVVTVDAVAPDVPPPPPPPPTGTQPLDSACERDDQCASGICANSAGLPRVCVQGCARNDDCFALGVTFNCALDRSAGGRWVCGEVERAGEDPGNACAVDADCFSNVCIAGRCHNACATDADCTAGWRCTPFSLTGGRGRYCGYAPITGVTVESYTLFDDAAPVDRSIAPARLLPAPDTVSIMWSTQDAEASNLYAVVTHVQAPDATALVDYRTWSTLRDQPIRTLPPRFQINSAMLPSRDMQRVMPGEYTSMHALLNGSMTGVDTRRMRATVQVKRAPGGVLSTGTVLLRVWFVGTRGINAATAMTNARFVAAVAEMRRIYAAAGLNVSIVGFVDASAADATRFSIIDSADELHELFTRTGGNPDPVLNLMFVRGISSTAGLENAVGVAGAIGGPAGVNGTVASGVVMGWETTMGGRTDILPQVMAHECGHYLGLWHPVEQLAPCTTATQTMCSILGGVDAIADTPTGAAATSNLMFWQAQGGTIVTAGQGVVMRGHMLVR
jgi:hypothetical protein